MKRIFKSAGIIIHDKKMLAVHKKGKKAGELIVPGGVLEHKESFEQALQREIMEELNVLISSYTEYNTFLGPAIYEQVELVMKCYHVNIIGIPKASNEIDQCVWVGKDYNSSAYTFASILGQQLLPQLLQDGYFGD
jgi:8-oxo-dGTP pyrophosphatase MutT (NUDIX family)